MTDDESTSGDLGVSSERVGPTGPGQVGTDGVRDIGQSGADDDHDAPPEQAPGGEDVQPDPPIPPVAGYSSRDPRSADHPFESDGAQSSTS